MDISNINKSISVFLPMCNEEENVRESVLEINDYLKNRFKDYEILVVSEGSKDRTNEIVKELQKKIDNLKLFDKKECFGYAAALRTGFKNSTKELIFYTDGDRQFDIKELDKLLPLIDQYDIVTGFKIKRHDPLMRIWMSFLYNLAMKQLFDLKVKDLNCAFKLYRRQVIDEVDFLPEITNGIINAEIYLTALKKGYTIGEIGVHHFHRAKGFASAEFGKRGKIIAFVKPSVILDHLIDIFNLWKKMRKFTVQT